MTFAKRKLIKPHARTLLAALLAVAMAIVLAGCDVSASPDFGTTTTGSGTETTIPIQVTKGQDNSIAVQVPVYINSRGPYSFILDTGASISLVDRQLARQLNLPRSGSRQPVVGVGGTEQVEMVDIAAWRVGSATLPKTSIAAGAVPSESGANGFVGLLGSDVLSQFGKITIDYNASVLTVYAQLNGRITPVSPARFALDWDIWRHAA